MLPRCICLMAIGLLLLLFPFLIGPLPAQAGTQDGAVVALHSKARAAKPTLVCAGDPASEDPVTQGIACSDFDTSPQPLETGRDVYLVVGRADPVPGIAGVSCGVLYESSNVGVFDWTLCADLEFPSGGWPASGAGNRITWIAATNCQTTTIGTDGVHAVAGAFYLYAYGNGTFEVGPNFSLGGFGEFRVADCGAAESDVVTHGSVVGFGDEQGYTPCSLHEVFPCTVHTPDAPKHCCCTDEFPPFEYEFVWEQYCEHHEGTVITGTCSMSCEQICAGAVPVERTSWGLIKAGRGE